MILLKIFRFLLFPLYLMSFFIPKNKNLWLFGGGHNLFAENAKELFLYVSSQETSQITPVWITGDLKLYHELKAKQYNVEYRWSSKGLYYSLRAKYYFYNIYPTDINFYTSGNAILINLWHGIPLKKIEFDVDTGKLAKWYTEPLSYLYMFLKPYIFKRPNYCLSTSPEASALFSSAFRIKESQCLSFGYPRNDIFFKKSTDKDIFFKKGRKNLIYMPTWRGEEKDFLSNAILNFILLNSVLKKHQLHLYIKLHPMTKKVKKSYSNISFLDSNIDIYSILPQTDYLITDYSSIFFDYLLLDKEIIFYPFDYHEYMNTERKLYYDYTKVTPGKTVYTFEKLLKVLSNLKQLNYASSRQDMRNRFWSYADGDASKRIFEYFKALEV